MSMSVSVIWLADQRQFDQINRSRVFLAAECDHAQKMQTGRVMRLRTEKLPDDPFRFGELSSLQMALCDGERICNRRRHDGHRRAASWLVASSAKGIQFAAEMSC